MHLWSGLVAGPLFLVLALSGVILVFAPELDAAMRPPGHAAERSPLLPLRSLHASLHAGRTGSIVVGLLGLALVAEGVTGVWLYGPSLRRRPSTRSIHRIVGSVSLIFAALVGVSGALLAFAAALAPTDALPPGLYGAFQRLHYGDFAGWPSRIVYAAVGVAVPVLSVTGFLLAARRQG